MKLNEYNERIIRYEEQSIKIAKMLLKLNYEVILNIVSYCIINDIEEKTMNRSTILKFNDLFYDKFKTIKFPLKNIAYNNPNISSSDRITIGFYFKRFNNEGAYYYDETEPYILVNLLRFLFNIIDEIKNENIDIENIDEIKRVFKESDLINYYKHIFYVLAHELKHYEDSFTYDPFNEELKKEIIKNIEQKFLDFLMKKKEKVKDAIYNSLKTNNITKKTRDSLNFHKYINLESEVRARFVDTIVIMNFYQFVKLKEDENKKIIAYYKLNDFNVLLKYFKQMIYFDDIVDNKIKNSLLKNFYKTYQFFSQEKVFNRKIKTENENIYAVLIK